MKKSLALFVSAFALVALVMFAPSKASAHYYPYWGYGYTRQGYGYYPHWYAYHCYGSQMRRECRFWRRRRYF
jgi:hypothetical protein